MEKKNPLLGLVGAWEGLPIPVILFGVHGNPSDLSVRITLGWRKLTGVVQGSICLYTSCNYFHPGAQWGVGFFCSTLMYITKFYCSQEGGPGGGAQPISEPL